MPETGGESKKNDQSTVVVSHIKSSRLPSKRVLSVIAVVGVLVLAVVAGAAFRVWQNKQGVQIDSGSGANTKTASGLSESMDEIQNLRLEGKEEEAQKKIQEQLAAGSTSDTEKYQLYIQQGNAYVDTKDYLGAINAYGKADAVKSTYETNTLLAETWKSLGNKAKAAEYYKKALPLIPNTPVQAEEKASVEQKIKDLEG